MEKVEEKNYLESLKEEVRIFRKREEATYDMLALYEVLQKDKNVDSLIGITLVEKLIHDLEDSETKILMKADTIHEVLRELDKSFYTILNKYKYIEECREYCDEFNTSYKEMIASRDMSSLFYRSDVPKFNFIHDLLYCSPQAVYKFLVSEIPFQDRLNMFAYVLGGCRFHSFSDFLNGPARDYLSKEEYQKAPGKMKEIVDAFNRNECKILSVQSLMNYVMEDKNLNHLIDELEYYGIDINPCYWQFPVINSIFDGRYISTVGLRFIKNRTVSSIKDSYEKESYLAVDKAVRNTNDLVILSYCWTIPDICNFIKLSHFEVTEEKVRFLAQLFMDGMENYDVTELNVKKDDFQKQNQMIADTIVLKSKNKKEYKQMVKYANLYMELTSLEPVIAQRKEEEMKQVEEQKLLKQKRKEFSTLLYNMNEYAQENIPSRVKVKDIPFGK